MWPPADDDVTIRAAGPDDLPFLRQMLYAAIFVPPGEPAPPPSILEEPSIAHYLPVYTGSSEHALVARRGGRSISAAWYRLFGADDPGYGYVADGVPELTVAVCAGFRARGVGTRPLRRLLSHARATGARALSLSVHAQNPARHLYERLGFVTVAQSGDAIKMVRRL